ncbi:hypothetical protein KM043_016433 [Ampulex compressa]|nr:hypothetical protein KM043_016433 [Ampulex compressa]
MTQPPALCKVSVGTSIRHFLTSTHHRHRHRGEISGTPYSLPAAYIALECSVGNHDSIAPSDSTLVLGILPFMDLASFMESKILETFACSEERHGIAQDD